MTTGIRPERLEDFVGQATARRIVSVLVTAAKRRKEPVPHVLMAGPPGLGKTTLARIVAHEMGGRLVEVVGSSIKAPEEMCERLLTLKEHDVLFVDEIHALQRAVEEQLYSAMEDRTVSANRKDFAKFMRQIGLSGNESVQTTHRLPAFTLIGATTLLGLCSAPLRSRFVQVLELEPYEIPDLQRIVTTAASKLSFDLPADLAEEIARRSRGTARIAIGHLFWFRDYVIADGGVATTEALEQAFHLKGIDAHGLGRGDRRYLQVLAESDDAVGLETLSATLGDSVETLQESLEPFLLRQGYIQRTSRGRIVTHSGREALAEVIA